MSRKFTRENCGTHIFSSNTFAVLLFHAHQQGLEKSEFHSSAEVMMEALGVTDVEEMKNRLRELRRIVIQWEEVYVGGRTLSISAVLDYCAVHIDYKTGESFVKWSFPWAIREQLLLPAQERDKGFIKSLASKLGPVTVNGILALGK
jgi:hypothetical protein